MLLVLIVPTMGIGAAATPSFTSRATFEGEVAAGKRARMVIYATSTVSTSVLVNVEIYGPSGARVYRHFFDKQWFDATKQRAYVLYWDVPQEPGTYTVKIAIHAPGWGTRYHWNERAAQVTIGGGAANPTPTATPRTATPTPAPSTPTKSPSATSTPTTAPAPTQAPVSSLGKTYYVAPWGNNQSAGTSSGSPLGSLQAGFDKLAPGDTLVLRGGTYQANATARLRTSGTSDRPITIRNQPGETPVLDGRHWLKQVMAIEDAGHIVVDGLTFVRSNTGWGASGLALADATDIRLTNITARDHREQGIFIDHGSRRIQVLGCDLSRSPTGMAMYGQHILVDGCRSYDNDKMVNNGADCNGGTGEHGGQAFDVAETPGPVEIRNSEGWNNKAWSICYGSDGAFVEIYKAQNVYVHHNRSRDGVVFVEAAGDTRGVRLTHNQVTNEQFLTTHQANNMEISNNTVTNLRDIGTMIWIGSGGSFGTGSTAGFVFRNNTISTTRIVWQVVRRLDGTANVDYNTYQNTGQFGISNYTDLMTLATWKSYTGKDAHSTMKN
jgi:hypothetical protein